MKIGITMPSHGVGIHIKKNYERTFKGVCTKEHEVNVSYYYFVLFLFLIDSSNNTMKKKIDMWTTLPCQHLLAQKQAKYRKIQTE